MGFTNLGFEFRRHQVSSNEKEERFKWPIPTDESQFRYKFPHFAIFSRLLKAHSKHTAEKHLRIRRGPFNVISFLFLFFSANAGEK